ncbi:hypothetical protein KFL_002120160 [Klebsormidium nitens]|uniref:Uncharacterized protein n=1 Tax=Klebsormidium nitens TaxID=105231 RepID=A0A1Y1I4N6_KLENI|nr:hypothetical protein KFL_002120160 [Klebsormidium nitens]|eukprot:GAQ84922.1 hypothetical protein KFL_002120160 [Klebsormidium nitens]
MLQKNAVSDVTTPEEPKDKRQKRLLRTEKEGQGRRQFLSWLLGGALADWSRLQWPGPASAAGWGLPWSTPAVQTAPSEGTCATCIGVVDDTLASCGSITNCVSSFDDRPPFFCAPWEYPASLPEAVRTLEQQIERLGGTVNEAQQKYVYATFVDEDGVIDDVEWLFSDSASDRIVQIHAASRAREQPDGGRNATRLEKIRAGLQWEQVPILRNRVRKFYFIESPWDTFGPEPPPGSYDYDNGFD